MTRSEFKERLKQYKAARELNPLLKYWEFIANNVDQYGNVISTEESPIYDEAYLKKQKQILDNLRVVDQIKRKLKEFHDARAETDKRGAIPFIKDKKIILSNAGKDTGVTLSTNVLDSIAKYADKADLPLSDALGLAGQESTFGKGYNSEAREILPSILVSNWNYGNTAAVARRSENPYLGLWNTANRKVNGNQGFYNNNQEFIYDLDFINVLKGGIPFADKEASKLGTDMPVLEHAFKKFKSGKYNPGDPNHTQMVKDRGKALMQSPEIQKWLKEKQGFAEGGEVTGPPTYEDWYKDITRPTLNTFDDAHLKVGMEEAAADLHNMAMLLPGYASKWGEYQKSKPKKDPSIKLFVNDLWENENPNNVGYRNGRYYPHGSPEGGTMTIGPGFKLGSGSHDISDAEAYSGMTKNRLNQEAIRVGKKHLNAVDLFLNYGQNTNPADTVSPLIKMGLMDLRHQVGPLNEWHNLRKAVLTGDLDKIKKESIVTWDDDGEIKVDTRRKKIRDAKYFHYSEGGEVELTPIDPAEMLARTRYQINGIPINDQPLSGTDPIGEAMMWGIGGGAAAAALRKTFPTYGAAAAWLAFGDNGNENALVVKKPFRKGNPTVKPISTGNISEDTRDFYREYVMPLSDHLTEQEKLDFINNNANFTYNVYPESRFDEGVLGFRNKYTGEIALNEKILNDPITFGRTMAHESDHALDQFKKRPRWQTYLINRNSPRTKNQKKTRSGSNSEAYATHEANKWDIVNNFELENGRKPTLKEFQQHTDVVPAKTLSSFRNRDSYGRMYEENEIKKLAQKHLTAYDYSKWLNTYKRNTLKYVPATIPFILTTNKEET